MKLLYPTDRKITVKKEKLNMITIDDFMKLKLVVATIRKVEEHPNAERLYLLTVNLGEEERTLVAGIKEFYTPEELVGKQMVVVENLAPATIRGVESRGMILAAKDGENLSIVTMDRYIAPGSLVS
ncbi:MAG: methionine--tRNA ligase subunit beta [Candidatus Auribacterota bacterium]|nr:methionine--tRNA ligase subunit beta [Candidatus Auribacterota bacterium]